MASFAQLTSLHCLLGSGGSLTQAGLQHLTALRRLKLLHVSGAGMCSDVARERLVLTAGQLPAGKMGSLMLRSCPAVSKGDAMCVQ